uniref:Uncharacterized protein n=1 Tax=Anguilla anguilla TaxID=7936 RepID=A0A0E9WRR9_ANGAN
MTFKNFLSDLFFFFHVLFVLRACKGKYFSVDFIMVQSAFTKCNCKQYLRTVLKFSLPLFFLIGFFQVQSFYIVILKLKTNCFREMVVQYSPPHCSFSVHVAIYFLRKSPTL